MSEVPLQYIQRGPISHFYHYHSYTSQCQVSTNNLFKPDSGWCPCRIFSFLTPIQNWPNQRV